MAIVQFRIHPGVGCARMGNSKEAYHLASEFPYFLQEEFPNLRFRPEPRNHPKKFFDTNPAGEGDLNGYNVYHSNAAFKNTFKEGEGKIFPQGVRFRVFAYVYDDDVNRRHPNKVFEVTADMADISWKVDIANKKAQVGGVRDENAATVDLVTSSVPPVPLLCKRVRRDSTVPNLAYVFLERDDADKTKVTGRLHVIGNEGELNGSISPTTLWANNWHDSAGDGPVQATITPKGDTLRKLAGASKVADLKYFDYDNPVLQPGTTTNIKAMPAWVVIGCPDYVPDMGHFVSLWDIALARGFSNLETGAVIKQPGKHKLIRRMTQFNTYKETDYLIHIHPQLCLFEDVRFVSGEAIGDPENRGAPPPPLRAHNDHRGGPPPPPDPDKLKAQQEAVKHGGITINARANKEDLKNRIKLKDPDSRKPIGAWLKRAVYLRLRKPDTLYDKERLFVTLLPGDPLSGIRRLGTFPRKYGRRMDYDLTSGGDRDVLYDSMILHFHAGNLLEFHGLRDADKLCGRSKSPPAEGPRGPLPPDELALLQSMDDMYWPATFSDMPLLRELAYTKLQYKQFEVWQSSKPGVRISNIFDEVLSPALKKSFSVAGALDVDKHFADFLASRSWYAPAIIDMAHLGAMIGGSFLPGIEVGREAGIAANWCLFHGARKHFPTIRFKLAGKTTEHTHGTLTKDLAIPWTHDFIDCDETYWPTSRPGRTTKNAVTLTRHNWLIERTNIIPHLGRTALGAEFVKEYWKALGFIRRETGNKFIEKEQSWH